MLTPVAQRRRHPVHIRAIAGSSPAGSTHATRAGQCSAGSHKPGGQVQLLGPRLEGLEVLRRHTTPVRWRSGFDSRRDLCTNGGACAKGASLPRTQAGWVRFPSSPHPGRRIAGSIRLLWKQDIAGSNPAVLTAWARRSTGGRQPGVLEVRVRLPTGPIHFEGSAVEASRPCRSPVAR